MKTRHITLLITITVTILSSASTQAQEYAYLQELEDNPGMIAGCDWLCPAEPVALTPAPKGYKPFYVYYYGRHGARYAWQDDLYSSIRDVFQKADSKGILTDKGKSFLERFETLWPDIKYNTGILSRKGWEQLSQIARTMYSAFPEAFKGEASVEAAASPTGRCILSMSSLCQGLKEMNPKLKITEHAGALWLDSTLPQSSSNPLRVVPESLPIAFDETWEEYIARSFDCDAMLGRLFTDLDAAVPAEKRWDLIYYLNYFVHGMASLDTDLDFYDIFTEEEQITIWKIDCFQFYTNAWPKHLGYMPIVRDIIERADRHIKDSDNGADVRIGHDSTVLPLMMILGVKGYDHVCTDPEEIPVWCRMNDVPMGANLQFVFYRPKKGGETLVKVLHNGTEARISVPTDIWPYYRWSDFKDTFDAPQPAK